MGVIEAVVFDVGETHLDTERKRRATAGHPRTFGEADLYPDARLCLAALRDMGLWVGIAGRRQSTSQPVYSERAARSSCETLAVGATRGGNVDFAVPTCVLPTLPQNQQVGIARSCPFVHV